MSIVGIVVKKDFAKVMLDERKRVRSLENQNKCL